MSWTAYQVVLRLHTPLHIGWGRVSYLQRARPYVTGRALRGALVTALTRLSSQSEGALNDYQIYRKIGQTAYQHLAFTYFFPALKKKNEKNESEWEECFPWEKEAVFRRRFLGSYAATSLNYPQQTAAEGLLYETEFISPYTLDTGEPVYLMGYIFAFDSTSLAWQKALEHGLQLGGERGYGWGRVSLAAMEGPLAPNQDGKMTFFEMPAVLEVSNAHPLLRVSSGFRLLAHAAAEGASIVGDVEPLVGREWHSERNDRKHIGQYLNFDNICYAPGSIVQKDTAFKIGKGGVWYVQPGA